MKKKLFSAILCVILVVAMAVPTLASTPQTRVYVKCPACTGQIRTTPPRITGHTWISGVKYDVQETRYDCYSCSFYDIDITNIRCYDGSCRL